MSGAYLHEIPDEINFHEMTGEIGFHEMTNKTGLQRKAARIYEAKLMNSSLRSEKLCAEDKEYIFYDLHYH